MPRPLLVITAIGGSAGSVALAIALLAGGVAGVGGYTFVYADGGSYLTDAAASCANCHVMQEHYDAWIKSSHHAVATCNDCHTPHDFAGKWATKAANGFRHSLAFTTGRFHEPIRITQGNRAIVENACRRCHQDLVQAIDLAGRGGIACVRCHDGVGHGP